MLIMLLNVWIVGVVDEGGRIKCVVDASMEFWWFRVAWQIGRIVWNIVWIVGNALKSCVSGFGLVIEYMSVGIELIVCSY